MDMMTYIIKLGLMFLRLNMLGDAVPWSFTFGSQGEINDKTGRIPELDTFLLDNAELLADAEDRQSLIPLARNMANQYVFDKSASYYIDLLNKIDEHGLDVLNSEQKRVNSAVGKVLFDNAGLSEEQVTHVMKQRNVLDAFFDAAALHAWPQLRGKIIHNIRDEL